jgi:hypothetical protein
MSEPFQIDTVGSIRVVRDDLIAGGTKARALPALLTDADEFVYASPVYGYAQIALAHTCARLAKRATVFCAQRKTWHPLTLRAASAGAKIVEVAGGYLTVVTARARDYARARGAKLLPFGLDAPEFVNALADAVSLAPLDHVYEVWSVAASGTMTRALQSVWPAADFHCVLVGTAKGDAGKAKLYRAPERFEQDAQLRPPFPSCPNYDAKAWRFVRAHASPGAVFWNVA